MENSGVSIDTTQTTDAALSAATRGLVIDAGGGCELVLTTESGILDRLTVQSVDEARDMVERAWEEDVLSRTPATAAVLWDGQAFSMVVHVLERL